MATRQSALLKRNNFKYTYSLLSNSSDNPSTSGDASGYWDNPFISSYNNRCDYVTAGVSNDEVGQDHLIEAMDISWRPYKIRTNYNNIEDNSNSAYVFLATTTDLMIALDKEFNNIHNNFGSSDTSYGTLNTTVSNLISEFEQLAYNVVIDGNTIRLSYKEGSTTCYADNGITLNTYDIIKNYIEGNTIHIYHSYTNACKISPDSILDDGQITLPIIECDIYGHITSYSFETVTIPLAPAYHLVSSADPVAPSTFLNANGNNDIEHKVIFTGENNIGVKGDGSTITAYHKIPTTISYYAYSHMESAYTDKYTYTFTLSQVAYDAYGHVMPFETSTYTVIVPVVNDAKFFISANSGGSIYEITSANSAEDSTLTVIGDDIISTDISGKTLSFTHKTTSTATSGDASLLTIDSTGSTINQQKISYDAYGHITGFTTAGADLNIKYPAYYINYSDTDHKLSLTYKWNGTDGPYEAGNIMFGNGTLISISYSADNKITFNHNNTGASDGKHGDDGKFLTSVTTDAFGHVTAVASAIPTITYVKTGDCITVSETTSGSLISYTVNHDKKTVTPVAGGTDKFVSGITLDSYGHISELSYGTQATNVTLDEPATAQTGVITGLTMTNSGKNENEHKITASYTNLSVTSGIESGTQNITGTSGVQRVITNISQAANGKITYAHQTIYSTDNVTYVAAGTDINVTQSGTNPTTYTVSHSSITTTKENTGTFVSGVLVSNGHVTKISYATPAYTTLDNTNGTGVITGLSISENNNNDGEHKITASYTNLSVTSGTKSGTSNITGTSGVQTVITGISQAANGKITYTYKTIYSTDNDHNDNTITYVASGNKITVTPSGTNPVTYTINHDTTTVTTSGTGSFVSSLETDSYGHITKVSYATPATSSNTHNSYGLMCEENATESILKYGEPGSTPYIDTETSIRISSVTNNPVTVTGIGSENKMNVKVEHATKKLTGVAGGTGKVVSGVTVDSYGHVSALSYNNTITYSENTNKIKTLSGDSIKKYLIGVSNTTTTDYDTTYFDSEIYTTSTKGELHVAKLGINYDPQSNFKLYVDGTSLITGEGISATTFNKNFPAKDTFNSAVELFNFIVTETDKSSTEIISSEHSDANLELNSGTTIWKFSTRANGASMNIGEKNKETETGILTISRWDTTNGWDTMMTFISDISGLPHAHFENTILSVGMLHQDFYAQNTHNFWNTLGSYTALTAGTGISFTDAMSGMILASYNTVYYDATSRSTVTTTDFTSNVWVKNARNAEQVAHSLSYSYFTSATSATPVTGTFNGSAAASINLASSNVWVANAKNADTVDNMHVQVVNNALSATAATNTIYIVI